MGSRHWVDITFGPETRNGSRRERNKTRVERGEKGLEIACTSATWKCAWLTEVRLLAEDVCAIRCSLEHQMATAAGAERGLCKNAGCIVVYIYDQGPSVVCAIYLWA